MKVSAPEVLPLSESLTPWIAVALPAVTVALVGAAITGKPLTVTERV